MHVDIAVLQRLIKDSLVLAPEKKKAWLRRLERMTEEQLQKLENLLRAAQGVDWDAELHRCRDALLRGQTLCDSVEQRSSPPL